MKIKHPSNSCPEAQVLPQWKVSRQRSLRREQRSADQDLEVPEKEHRLIEVVHRLLRENQIKIKIREVGQILGEEGQRLKNQKEKALPQKPQKTIEEKRGQFAQGRDLPQKRSRGPKRRSQGEIAPAALVEVVLHLLRGNQEKRRARKAGRIQGEEKTNQRSREGKPLALDLRREN